MGRPAYSSEEGLVAGGPAGQPAEVCSVELKSRADFGDTVSCFLVIADTNAFLCFL